MKKFMLSLLLIVTVVSCAEAQQVEKKVKMIVKSVIISDEAEDVQIVFKWMSDQIMATWNWPQYSTDYIFSFFINGEKKKLPIDWNKCFLPTDVNTFQLWIQEGTKILKSPIYKLVLEQKK